MKLTLIKHQLGVDKNLPPDHSPVTINVTRNNTIPVIICHHINLSLSVEKNWKSVLIQDALSGLLNFLLHLSGASYKKDSHLFGWQFSSQNGPNHLPKFNVSVHGWVLHHQRIRKPKVSIAWGGLGGIYEEDFGGRGWRRKKMIWNSTFLLCTSRGTVGCRKRSDRTHLPKRKKNSRF